MSMVSPPGHTTAPNPVTLGSPGRWLYGMGFCLGASSRTRFRDEAPDPSSRPNETARKSGGCSTARARRGVQRLGPGALPRRAPSESETRYPAPLQFVVTCIGQ